MARVEANGAFDHRVAFETLARHTVVGLDRVDPTTSAITKLIDVDGPLEVTVTLDPGGATLTAPTTDESLVEALSGRVTRWFDLDTDLTPINAHLSATGLAASVAARPGVRLTRFTDPFEAAVLTVLGQRISVAAARVIGGRLMAAYGGYEVAGLRTFPTPAALASADVDELRAAVGTPLTRAKTVQAVARLLAEAGLALPGRDELLALPGVGPWTVDLLEIRAGTDPDSFPMGDMVLQRSMAAAGIADPPVASEEWRPWRSYAAVRLWAMDPGPRRPQSGGRRRSRGGSAPAQA